MRFRLSLNNPWFIALMFTLVALVFTWPLAATLFTQNAADLGDPLFNCWVMLWTSGQVLRFLKGDWHALAEYWNANIFYPEALTLTYSEHLTGEMLQILPLFAATGNIILCYNLLFLSTFVLSGLGMYLLVRELTGRPLAALLAGVAFAFAPYRADQLSHLQVLSSHWMPFALYGFHRYFATGRQRALIGASAAMVMQILSCGYYFFFFVPVAAAYCLYELVSRRLWAKRRVLIELAAAGAVTLMLVLPFLLPYTQVRATQNIGRRSLADLAFYSAGTHMFATTSETLRFRAVKGNPQPEGQLFPGAAILAFAGAGLVAGLWTGYTDARRRGVPAGSRWRRIAGGVALTASAALLAGFVVMAVRGRTVFELVFIDVSMSKGPEALVKALLFFGAGWLLLPRLRAALSVARRHLVGFSIAVVVVTALFALGLQLNANGRSFGTGPYWLLYQYVPGFDGLRVPSRFLMVTILFLSILAGTGAAWLVDRWRRAGATAVTAGMILMLAEGWIAPMAVGRPLWQGVDLMSTAFDTPTRSTLNELYARVRDEPGHVVVIEFPYGERSYDIRAAYMAGFHRKPLLNGYSGFFPQSFLERFPDLGGNSPSVDRDVTWAALQKAGVTHVIVHEAAFDGGRGAMISDGLRSLGARELVAAGRDHLFAMQ